MYAELKTIPGVQKTFKFKQSHLMRSVVDDDQMLDSLSTVFRSYKIDAETAKRYASEIGACSIFSVRWLSEVLGVPYEQSIREPERPGHGQVVLQGMMNNVYVKEVVGKDDNRTLLPTLLKLHGLQTTGQRLQFSEKTLPLIAQRSGSYLIECGPNNNHAVAITDFVGGMFFDPNVGEYSFVSAQREQKKQFLSKWWEIHDKRFGWHEFICYQVNLLL